MEFSTAGGCCWTPSGFASGAARLVEVLERRYAEDEPPAAAGLDWSWRSSRASCQQGAAGGGGGGLMIIEHSPLVRMTIQQQQQQHCCDRDAESRRSCEYEKRSHHGDQSDDEDLQLMADDASLWEDADAAVVFLPVNNKQSTPSGEAAATVWRLSVVYSETWRVPVLYFTVCHQRTGDPCTRAQVLEFLLRCQQQQKRQPQNWGSEEEEKEHEDSSWDFVSVTEHPATGTPCFFLHPCRTSERLQTLLQTTTTPSTANTSTHSATLLWSWFSLILPSLGLSIPPRTYLEVQQQLRGDDDDK